MSSKLFGLLVRCGVIVSIAAMPVTSIARPKTPLSTVKCECTCEVPAGGGTLEEDKSFAAPGGDPKACGGLNGTKCRVAGVNPSEGKLTKCEGVVERKMPPAATGTDDLQVSPGTSAPKPKVPKEAPPAGPDRN